jgi:hypothetical protein
METFHNFTLKIIQILNFLPLTGIDCLLALTLFDFLAPVQFSKSVMTKVLLFGKFLTILMLFFYPNYASPVAVAPYISLPPLTNATTLHSIFSLYPMPFSQILPFSNKPIFANDSLLQRSPIKS